jgi:hypothetical protein
MRVAALPMSVQMAGLPMSVQMAGLPMSLQMGRLPLSLQMSGLPMSLQQNIGFRHLQFQYKFIQLIIECPAYFIATGAVGMRYVPHCGTVNSGFAVIGIAA